MPILLYIHGFLSSPSSFKAQQLGVWLQEHHPEIDYQCPFLTPYPEVCGATLEAMVQQAQQTGQLVYLMGSSMGGFWATYLAEKYNLPAVLINPAVDVMNLMPKYLHQPLNNYHTDDVYCLKTDDLMALSRYDTSTITRHNNYWLLVQTADETLDYRLALEKYSQCQQTVEQDGDHAFQQFERFHEPAIRFFEQFYAPL